MGNSLEMPPSALGAFLRACKSTFTTLPLSWNLLLRSSWHLLPAACSRKIHGLSLCQRLLLSTLGLPRLGLSVSVTLQPGFGVVAQPGLLSHLRASVSLLPIPLWEQNQSIPEHFSGRGSSQVWPQRRG